MHIVTSSPIYIDIDAYAAAVAFAELLRLQGESALAASSAPLNESVPPSLRALDVKFETNYRPSPNDVFTIVDLSDPDSLDLGATSDNVVRVIDHHLGFEDFWKKKLGDEAHIEFVGAACTQVYELWQQAGLLDRISKNSAKLLACGILDNTLNLQAVITTKRDKTAYADLAQCANLADDWQKQYFSECQSYMLSNVADAVENDAKTIRYPSLPHDTRVGQLALWDAKDFLNSEKRTFQSVLEGKHIPWYMNIIDIHSGKSIFLCQDPRLKEWLAELLNVVFEGDTATANRMWLRKEIMKQALEK